MEKQVVFFGACYYSGLIGLARLRIQRSGQRLIILNYHRASGGDLRRHLFYLKRHYRMMHLEEALEELYTPRKGKKQKIRDRRTPLVLTFDDGYRDNYMSGYALARELRVPITIFLIPGYIEKGTCFWWLAGDHLVSHAQVEEVSVEGHTYHLNQQKDQQSLAQVIYTRALSAGSVSEREEFLEMVRKLLGAPVDTLDGAEDTVLKWEEIHEMEKSGWVSFGAHTMHHPVLAYLTDPLEVLHEVRDCRTVLEEQLGHPVRVFAYPLGRDEHISDESLRAVHEAGYAWAVTTNYGINSPKNEPQQLRRIVGDVKRHWLLLAADISGLEKFFSPLFPYGRTLLSAGERILSLTLSPLAAGYRLAAGKAQSPTHKTFDRLPIPLHKGFLQEETKRGDA